MIQSGIFDSSIMNIKKLTNSILIFTINRLIEIVGILILSIGVLFFLSLISHSPSDPNFIFPEGTKIKNLLGFHGSYISDFFFQSFGLISYLIPITYIFTGINIFRKKEIFLIIENTFFSILYLSIGSLFFAYFYKDSFSFYINGNGGFVGNYFDAIFFKAIVDYENTLFYFFILLITIFFSISINLNVKNLYNFLKLKFSKENQNYTNKMKLLMNIFLRKKLKI